MVERDREKEKPVLQLGMNHERTKSRIRNAFSRHGKINSLESLSIN